MIQGTHSWQEEFDDALQQAPCSVCGEYGCECLDEDDPFAEDQSLCSCGNYHCGGHAEDSF